MVPAGNAGDRRGRRYLPTGREGAITVEILQLLDELEEEINAARRMPLGGGVVVDRRRMLELIEELRRAIPANIRRARGIVEQTEQTLAEAEDQAARIITDAEREAVDRISQSTVLRLAQEEAHQVQLSAQDYAEREVAGARAEADRLLAEAAARANAQEQEADQYALAVFDRLEERLAGFLTGIREAKSQLRE